MWVTRALTPNRRTHVGNATPMIRMAAVTKHFGSLRELKDIDLAVDRGQVVVCSGRPGRQTRQRVDWLRLARGGGESRSPAPAAGSA